MMNREVVAKIFFNRTGIKYQNWIQAWAVTKMQKEGKNTADCFKNISYFNRKDD